MNEFLKGIEATALTVPEGGAVIIKVETKGKGKRITEQIETMLRPVLIELSRKTGAPILIIPAEVEIETMTHDELRALGILTESDND